MKRHKIGTQGNLFGAPGAADVEVRLREPAVPYGVPDRSGRLWWERMRDDVMDLPEGTREAVLAVLLCWPDDRREALRLILDRWKKAAPLDRDNFCEGMGF